MIRNSKKQQSCWGNKMSELVSIIMPSYNTGEFISNSIQSVLNQTHENWELIIVDDCSTDNTDNVVSTFLKDPRINYIKNVKNYGAAISRNRALREARGKWIAFLDSDDLWVPEKLEEQIRFMNDHNYAFSYTDYMINLNGAWLPYIYIGPNVVNRRRMYDYCYFSTITVMYNRETIGLIQIEDLRKNNDYAMWLKIIEKSNCYRLPKCMSYYIKHEGSVSSGNKFRLIKWHYILYKDGLHKNRIISSLLTVRNLFFGIIKKIRYRKKTNIIPSVYKL